MLKKNAHYALRSKSFAESSNSSARAGQEVVQEMRGSIRDIGQSNLAVMDQVNESNRQMSEIAKVISDIGAKTKVINDIVFQTKLLSFNASVEAARAGEHGKGFAVVAEEVGNLAQMSGNAAKEIHSMLESSIRTVESIAEETRRKVEGLVSTARERIELGNATAERCSTSLGEIVGQAGQLTELMTSIASASGEQASGVSEINQAVGQLDQLTQRNARASDETARTAEHLRERSAKLLGAVDTLRSTLTGEELARREIGRAREEAPRSVSEPVDASEPAAKAA
jgi:methyl-accepting chemotaxis protein